MVVFESTNFQAHLHTDFFGLRIKLFQMFSTD
jgi:hypothetical protein